MDPTTIQILVAITVIAAVYLRLVKTEGWDLLPKFYEGGKFQTNTLLIIITAIIAALQTVNFVDYTNISDINQLIIMLWVLFTATYGTPAAIDGIGTALPIGNTPTQEQ